VSRRLIKSAGSGPRKPDVGLSGGKAAHFWQKRYYDFNVHNHEQLVEKLHYIHQNPVTAGLCDRPEDWPWSSFRHYASGFEGRVEIESGWSARKRERAEGNCVPLSNCPTQAKGRLEWATGRSEQQTTHFPILSLNRFSCSSVQYPQSSRRNTDV